MHPQSPRRRPLVFLARGKRFVAGASSPTVSGLADLGQRDARLLAICAVFWIGIGAADLIVAHQSSGAAPELGLGLAFATMVADAELRRRTEGIAAGYGPPASIALYAGVGVIVLALGIWATATGSRAFESLLTFLCALVLLGTAARALYRRRTDRTADDQG